MTRGIPTLVLTCIAMIGCGSGLPEAPGFTGLLRVVRIQQTPIALILGGDRTQQVNVDVYVELPDCTAFGDTTSSVEGGTYRFEVHGSQAACTGANVESFGIAIGPGLGQPGRLADGEYVIIVNGFVSHFVVPEPS